MEGKGANKMRGLKKLLIFLIVVCFTTIALGCIFPGLLWIKSLGIKYTEADYKSIIGKLGYAADTLPNGDSLNEYGPPKAVDVEFTSEEITALINENKSDYYAIKNAQVRINNDGTIEIVGSANVDYFLNEILGGKYSKEQISGMIPMLGLLPSIVNIYIDFSGSVTNNNSDINIRSISVQGVQLPSSIVNSYEAKNEVTEGFDNLMSKYNTKSGSSFDKIVVQNGKIVFKGKISSSIEINNK